MRAKNFFFCWQKEKKKSLYPPPKDENAPAFCNIFLVIYLSLSLQYTHTRTPFSLSNLSTSSLFFPFLSFFFSLSSFSFYIFHFVFLVLFFYRKAHTFVPRLIERKYIQTGTEIIKSRVIAEHHGQLRYRFN